MCGLEIPLMGRLRLLLFKNPKEKNFYRRKQRKRRGCAHLIFSIRFMQFIQTELFLRVPSRSFASTCPS